MYPKLTVVTGPMFSGKTRYTLWLTDRAKIAERPVQVFVPAMDHRNGVGVVRSHNGEDLAMQGVGAWTVSPGDVHALATRIRFDNALVILDEAQFMPPEVVDQVKLMLTKNRHVVVAGLSQDAEQQPFGPMPKLMSLADEIVMLTAICAHCRQDNASMTRRLRAGGPQIQLGAADLYEPLCRRCFNARVSAELR